MFGKLKLKQRMYLQLFLAVLPLAVVFSFQMTSTSDLPANVDQSLSVYDLCLRASASYKNFLNGVGDAVDTGTFSSKTLNSLGETQTLTAALLIASPTPGIKTTAESLEKIQAAIAANNSIGSVTPLKAEINAIDAALSSKISEIKTQLSNLVDDDTKATREKNRISLIAALVTLILVAFIVRQMVNGVTKPIALAVNTAQHVSKGDLTSHIEVSRHDEIGELQQAFSEMNDALIVIVDEVRTASQEITAGTSEMVSGNSDLSARTEQQSISLEKTAANIEQLSAAVAHNADNSRQANEFAQNASEVAVKGGKIVGQVVETMDMINKSSSQIVEIVAVIEDIAFQTNILALNAAVEAARAGEQGRGFAVVASEVRNLAQRSAAAAKKIKTMIENSTDKVNDGAKLVKQAGDTMQDIVIAVSRVTKMMAEIQDASAEQKVGIHQVSDAIQQMNEVTQQNAALVEEATAIAAAVLEQTEKLTTAVEKFKIPSVGVESIRVGSSRQEMHNEYLALR
jgi:methyl-accepting chemotaxis protein